MGQQQWRTRRSSTTPLHCSIALFVLHVRRCIVVTDGASLQHCDIAAVCLTTSSQSNRSNTANK